MLRRAAHTGTGAAKNLVHPTRAVLFFQCAEEDIRNDGFVTLKLRKGVKKFTDHALRPTLNAGILNGCSKGKLRTFRNTFTRFRVNGMNGRYS